MATAQSVDIIASMLGGQGGQVARPGVDRGGHSGGELQ